MSRTLRSTNANWQNGLTASCLLLVPSISEVSLASSSADFVIEEVTVTAERRESNLQSVPVAVSSFSQRDLEEKQVNDIGDLQAMIPNLSIHVGDANNAVVYLRGIGQIDSIAFFEPGVGIYLDDVYLGRAQGGFLNVIDVERIEVLRGPQGSLYGRNSVGGAVKYISARPTNELSGNTSATFGDYNRKDFKASVSGTLIDNTLLGRITVAQLTRDGYADNIFNNDDDGDKDTDFFRGALLLDATDNLSIQWAVDYTFSDPDHSRTPSKETPINLTDKEYRTHAFDLSAFPGVELAYYNPPRTYSLSAAYKF